MHDLQEELSRFENLASKTFGHPCTNILLEQECEAYFGGSLQIGTLSIKFRKAKITPKKVGQFVTLWKRDFENKTIPYTANDPFDFYLILTEQADKLGFFLFPKKVLIEKQILSSHLKEGKRGFRLYPDWAITENVQATKTQIWQSIFFINVVHAEAKNIEKLKSIINL